MAWAQQIGRVARVGLLMRYPDADLEARARVAQFKQELAKLGWIEGRNVQIEERWVDLANA
jgi:putative tryptophan/tyrosine transport system substrate-binding protein